VRSLVVLTLAVVACSAQATSLQDAEKELFGARYKSAAELYAKIVKTDPAQTSAYYGLVRALIKDHRSEEAYAVAADALQKYPQVPDVLTAAGLAAYRHGDLAKAEQDFRLALRLDADDAGALKGLASIDSNVSLFKTSRELAMAAWHKSPRDPELMIAHANTLKGAEHVAALQAALAILDPESESARWLKAHIANDIAVGERKLSRLTSPYQKSTIKLFGIRDGPSHAFAVGIRVQFNESRGVDLLLDTGASGISVSPKVAERAGLEILGNQAAEVKGIGDERAQTSYDYLASEVRIGDVVFANVPISVFRAAKSQDFDGLIGADVFHQFITTIDFPRMELSLEPRSAGIPSESDEPRDAGPPVSGFNRAVRFGNHLALPTFINDGKPTLFLIDSGSSFNFIDTTIGRESSKVYRDGDGGIRGIQGKVKEVSRADRVTLLFAGFRQENPSLVAISLEKMSDSMGAAFGGVLGWPVLSQLVLTIDYRDGTLRFQYKK